MMNKKIIGIFIAFMFIGTCFIPIISGNYSNINDIGAIAKISMDNVDVPGDSNGYGFLIVSNVTFLGSCDITLSWDPDVVNVTDVGDSEFYLIEYYVNYTAGILNIVAFSYDDMNGDFTIANVTFESAPGAIAGDQCDLEITDSMLFTNEPFPSEIDHICIDGTATIFGNSRPNKPEINGSITGEKGTEYEYTFVTSDPNGDDVTYIIDWGDTSDEEIIGPYPSREIQTVSHTWDEKGEYTIRAKARDIKGAESNWTELEISMPKTNAYASLFLTFLQNHPHLFPLLRQILGL